MFQFSFNFNSSVKLSFHLNSRLNFLTVVYLGRISVVDFPLNFTFIYWEASCLFEILRGCSRSEWQNLPVVYSFFPLLFGLRIRTEGPIVVLDKLWEVAFWCRIVWDYFFLCHSGQIKCLTWSVWFRFRNIFFIVKGFFLLLSDRSPGIRVE